nr:hypothetical protein [Tanacetum cinerariifolium]
MTKLVHLCKYSVQMKLRRHHSTRTGLVRVVGVWWKRFWKVRITSDYADSSKKFLELECQNKDRYSYVKPQGHVTHLQHIEELFRIVTVEWFVMYLVRLHLDQQLLRKVNWLTQQELELLIQELERQR